MKQTVIALDQVVNTLVWSEAEGWGRADDTLSARAWRLGTRYPSTWGRFERAVNALFFWEEDHCFNAYLAEKERKQLPKEYRRA